MGHTAIFTRMKGFQKLITTSVLKISKSATFSQKRHFQNLTKEIKCKTCVWFEPATQIASLSFNWLSYLESYHMLYK